MKSSLILGLLVILSLVISSNSSETRGGISGPSVPRRIPNLPMTTSSYIATATGTVPVGSLTNPSTLLLAASCSTGDFAVSGGWSLGGEPPGTFDNAPALNGGLVGAGATPNGWLVGFVNTVANAFAVTVYAVCETPAVLAPGAGGTTSSYVATVAGTIPIGPSTRTDTANCNAGDYALGGGWALGNEPPGTPFNGPALNGNPAVAGNKPNGWQVAFLNPNSIAYTYTLYVVCQHPINAQGVTTSGYVATVKGTIPVGPSTLTDTANCNVGDYAAGGGWALGNEPPGTFNNLPALNGMPGNNLATPNGWQIGFVNPNTAVSYGYNVYVVCQTIVQSGNLAWVPAGAMQDQLQITFYPNQAAEFNALTANTIDLMDTRIDTAPISAGICNSSPSLALSPMTSAGQFCFQNSMRGVVNSANQGVPNYYSFLNSWNPAPTIVGTGRWAFAGSTTNLSPFTSTSPQELLVLANIYDPLIQSDPYNAGTLYGWIANQWQFLPPQPGDPVATVVDVKFNIRADVAFQDGLGRLTASDVLFTILAYQGHPASFFSPLVSHVIGVRIQNDFNFIVNLDANFPTILRDIGSVPIIPQHIWGTAVGACSIPNTPTCTVNPALVAADPVASYLLVGSGPWICFDTILGKIGGKCTSTGIATVLNGGTITLQRNGFGIGGLTNLAYFRDSAKYRQWQWSDVFNHGIVDILDASNAASCFGKSVALNPSCAHWDTPAATLTCTPTAGICNPATGLGVGGNNSGTVTFLEVTQVFRWFGASWTSPQAYTTLVHAQPIPQIVYEGGITFS